MGAGAEAVAASKVRAVVRTLVASVGVGPQSPDNPLSHSPNCPPPGKDVMG